MLSTPSVWPRSRLPRALRSIPVPSGRPARSAAIRACACASPIPTARRYGAALPPWRRSVSANLGYPRGSRISIASGGSGSAGVVKNDAQRKAIATAQAAHAVTHVDAIDAAAAFDGPLAHRENDSLALTQWRHLDARLHARALLGQGKFAPGEVCGGGGYKH